MLTKTSLQPFIIEHNLRHVGYKIAAEQVADPDLRPVFRRLSSQSRDFAEEVKKLPAKETGAGLHYPALGGTAWHQIRTTAGDRKALLSCCENCENAIIKGYDHALTQSEEMPSVFQEMILGHRQALQLAYNEIKALREKHGHF